MSMKIDTVIRASIATALVLSAGTALAFPGHLTGITAQKSVVKVGEPVQLVVTGTVQCGVAINNGDGKTWNIALTDPSSPPSKSFSTSYNKPGKYQVVAKGRGNTDKDCSSISSAAVDITVLGAPPVTTLGAATAEVAGGIAQPGLSLAPTKITEIALSSTHVPVGEPFTIQVKGSGVKPQDCPSSIVIDQLTPKVVMDYFHQPAKWNSNGFPRNETFIMKDEGTYQVRLMLHDWSSSCVNPPLTGNLAKFTVGPAIPK